MDDKNNTGNGNSGDRNSGWFNSRESHIIPETEGCPHDESPDCWCSPEDKEGNIETLDGLGWRMWSHKEETSK